MTSLINNGKECNFSKFSDYIELGGVVDKSGCFAIMQRDVNRLERKATGTSCTSTNEDAKPQAYAGANPFRSMCWILGIMKDK